MDPIQLQNMPFNAASSSYRQDLTDASASLALPVGGYFVYLASVEQKGCTLKLGGTAAAPTSGGGAVAGACVLPPGVPMTLEVRTAASLHGIMNATSATGVLYLTKVR